MKIFNLSIVVAALLSSLFMGCSDDNNDKVGVDVNKNEVKLKGSFGSSYAFYEAPWYSISVLHASSFNDVKNAVAIPLHGRDVVMSEARSLNISSSGDFTVDLGLDYDWIVVLEKSGGDFEFLSIPVGEDSNDTLVEIPIKSAKGDLSIGDVNSVVQSKEASSTKRAEDIIDVLSYNIEDLQAMAKIDDVQKSVVNSYRNNYQKSSDNQILETIDITVGEMSGLNENSFKRADYYQGFAISTEFRSETDIAKNATKICDNNLSLSLKFPQGEELYTSVDRLTQISTETKAMSIGTRDGVELLCYGGQSDYINFTLGSNGTGKVGFFYGDQNSSLGQNEGLPEGLFDLQIDGVSQAKFNLNYGLPITANKELTVPVPAAKIHTKEGSREIDYIELTWWLFNDVSQSYELIDLKPFANTLDDIATDVSYQLTSGHNGCPLNEDYTKVDFTACSDEATFDVIDPSNLYQTNDMRTFSIQYFIGHTLIRFNFSQGL